MHVDFLGLAFAVARSLGHRIVARVGAVLILLGLCIGANSLPHIFVPVAALLRVSLLILALAAVDRITVGRLKEPLGADKGGAGV
jgi:hypothetical protein